MSSIEETLEGILDKHGIDTESFGPFSALMEPPIYQVQVNADDVFDIWLRLRMLVPETRFWPVILGPEDDASEWYDEYDGEELEDSSVVTNAIAEAGQEGINAWITRRVASRGLLRAAPHGSWSNSVGWNRTFSTFSRLADGHPGAFVIIALVPTPNSWEVPAFLRYCGAANEEISPADHVRMLHYWHVQHGVELVVLWNDFMELSVPRPVLDRDAALGVAWEYFVYCPDAVYQGLESIEALASSIIGSTVWSLWWD